MNVSNEELQTNSMMESVTLNKNTKDDSCLSSVSDYAGYTGTGLITSVQNSTEYIKKNYTSWVNKQGYIEEQSPRFRSELVNNGGNTENSGGSQKMPSLFI